MVLSSLSSIHHLPNHVDYHHRRPRSYCSCLSAEPSSLSSQLPLQSQQSITSSSSSSSQNYNKERTIRIVTWNVLAPVYASPYKYYQQRHPSYHNGHEDNPDHLQPNNYLDWSSHRQNLIVQKLRSIQADFVCLQEIQIDLWHNPQQQQQKQNDDSYNINNKKNHGASESSSSSPTCFGFRHVLEHELHYTTTVLQNVSSHHPVATAIAIHSSSGITVRRVESRSRALLVVLEMPSPVIPTTSTSGTTASSKQQQLIYLANVHFDAGAGPDHDLTRYNQIKSLLKRLQHHIALDDNDYERAANECNKNHNNEDDLSSSSSPPPRIILCGDFNLMAPHPLYQFLETGLYPTRVDGPNQRHQGSTPPIKPFVSPLLPFQNTFTTWNNEKEEDDDDKHDRVMDGSNRFFSSNQFMTFRSGQVLDYIWISPKSLQALETTWYYPTGPIVKYWRNNNNSENTSSNNIRTTTDNDNNKGKRWSFLPQQKQQQKKFPPRHYQRWPNEHHPSDHIPIGAILRITSLS